MFKTQHIELSSKLLRPNVFLSPTSWYVQTCRVLDRPSSIPAHLQMRARFSTFLKHSAHVGDFRKVYRNIPLDAKSLGYPL